MRKLFFFVFFAFAAFNGVYGQDVVDPSKQNLPPKIERLNSCGGISRPLRVAGMIGNAPFGWVERNNRKDLESHGLGRVVLDKIAKQNKLYYRTTAFLSQEDALLALRKGNVDMLLGVYYTTDLGKEIEVVEPAYFTNVFNVYFKKGKELPVESYEDLVGLKGSVRKEELIYPLIYKKLPRGINLKQVLLASEAFKMLMNEEVDYILASPYALEGELRRYKMQDDIVTDGTIFGYATMFFALSKNSPCLELKTLLSDSLRRNNFSQKTLDADIRKLVDNWGERFRSDEVLIETENNTFLEKEKEAVKVNKKSQKN